jgi:hypothetical protein
MQTPIQTVLRMMFVEKDESMHGHVPTGRSARHSHTVPAHIYDLVCIVIHLEKHGEGLLVGLDIGG